MKPEPIPFAESVPTKKILRTRRLETEFEEGARRWAPFSAAALGVGTARRPTRLSIDRLAEAWGGALRRTAKGLARDVGANLAAHVPEDTEAPSPICAVRVPGVAFQSRNFTSAGGEIDFEASSAESSSPLSTWLFAKRLSHAIARSAFVHMIGFRTWN